MRRSTRVILIVCTILTLALGILLAREILRPHPIRVALVGLEGRQRDGFLRCLEDFKKTRPVLKGTGNLVEIGEYARFEDLLPLIDAPRILAPVPDLIIAPEGLGVTGHARLFAPIPHDLANRSPLSMRIELSRDDRLRALPLLVNSLEIAGSRIWDSTLGHSPGSTAWFESLRAAMGGMESRTKIPLLLTGADDELLSLVVSALVLEEGGLASYSALCTAISQAADSAALESIVSSGRIAALEHALDRLSTWADSGLLPSNWLHLDKDDQALLLEDGRVISLIQTLACRRDMPYQHIFNYRAAPFPSGSRSNTTPDTVLAPAIVAIIPESGRRREISTALLDWMSAGDPLWQLARDCGWAAATTGTRQPDIQAMDSFARGAAAFSTANGILRDAFINNHAAAPFMAALRERLSR